MGVVGVVVVVVLGVPGALVSPADGAGVIPATFEEPHAARPAVSSSPAAAAAALLLAWLRLGMRAGRLAGAR